MSLSGLLLRPEITVSNLQHVSCLRHSYASSLATNLDLAATSLARATGHSDAGFTYAKDARDEAAFVSDVLNAPRVQGSVSDS
jgi:hypothetical protein